VNSISIYASNNNLSDDDYLFFSSRNRDEHIKRSRASKIIAKAGDMIGIVCSAHSLRKTFGYLAYKNGTSIELLMQIFNHSSQSVTLRYIGITQENINEVYDSINISF
jgi:integrase